MDDSQCESHRPRPLSSTLENIELYICTIELQIINTLELRSDILLELIDQIIRTLDYRYIRTQIRYIIRTQIGYIIRTQIIDTLEVLIQNLDYQNLGRIYYYNLQIIDTLLELRRDRLLELIDQIENFRSKQIYIELFRTV